MVRVPHLRRAIAVAVTSVVIAMTAPAAQAQSSTAAQAPMAPQFVRQSTTDAAVARDYRPAAVSGDTMIFTRVDPARAAPVVGIGYPVTSRMSVLYVTDPAVRAMLATSPALASVPWMFRQEPSTSGPGARLGGDSPTTGNGQRMSKISGGALAQMSAPEMEAALAARIRSGCTTPAGVDTCAAHLVAVDEITSRFGVPPGGRASDSPGRRLQAAMVALQRRPWPEGGTYADRVHFYLAPGVSTSISAGFGPSRNLDSRGAWARRDYAAAATAMGRAGGVWLEMYHNPARGMPRQPFSAAEWAEVPERVAAFLTQRSSSARNALDYLHFVMSDSLNTPEPGPWCVTGSASQASQDNLPACTPAPPCPVVDGIRTADMPGRQIAVSLRRRLTGGIITQLLRQRSAQEAVLSQARIMSNDPLIARQPQTSGMACQWARARGSLVNMRILANGPGAFRLSPTDAGEWAAQFQSTFEPGVRPAARW